MLVEGRQLMLAKSTIFITDTAWRRAAEEEGKPVGSLFRHFGVMPTFTLHSAGICTKCFWRQYQLQAAGMTCEINETFDLAALSEELPPLPHAEY